MEKKCFGEFISEKRKKQNMSLREMAALLGISSPYLWDIEHGKRNALEFKMLNKISKILKLTKQEYSEMMDLAGRQRKEAPPDLLDYIINTPGLTSVLRKAKELDFKEFQWLKILKTIESWR